jgi:hypothetical protein
MTSSSEFSKSLIALACWRAARTETYQVMLAVCMVFRNRADATGGDIYTEAIRWLEANPNEDWPDPRDPNFLNLLSRLDGVTSGLTADKTAGALYFAPKPSENKITGQITATLGQMNFIRKE